MSKEISCSSSCVYSSPMVVIDPVGSNVMVRIKHTLSALSWSVEDLWTPNGWRLFKARRNITMHFSVERGGTQDSKDVSNASQTSGVDLALVLPFSFLCRDQ